MAAGLDVWVYANRDARGGAPALHLFGRFVEEDIELGFGFDVEEQESARAGRAAAAAIAKSFANFFAVLADSGKNNFIAGDAEMTEMFELAARDDVEAAAELCQ